MKRKKSFGSGKGLRKLRKMKGSASSLMSETPKKDDEQDEALEEPKAKSRKQHPKSKAAAASKTDAKPKATAKAKAAAPASSRGKGAASAQERCRHQQPIQS